MESSNGLSNLRNSKLIGPPLLLPPNMAYETEFNFPHSLAEFEAFSQPKEGLRRHQRTFSDSMLIEETPSWVKDLLDEPETPLVRSHRRSSSDTIAYFEIGPMAEEADATYEKQNVAHTQGSFLQQHRCLHPNPSSNRTDTKRVKRHSAQHYRARKVQYIAELERSIQVFHAEGYEVSAELEFLDQQNLILGMENRALKQRLDSLSQEQFIKSLEQEMLEKEITRLRNLYQQQQQKQQHKHHGKPRSKYQDLDASFAKLSLKNKGTELQKSR